MIAFKNRSIHLSIESFKMLKQEENKTEKCDKLSQVYLDFSLLGECDQGVISHSGFGLYGVLNSEKSWQHLYENFYVFANPDRLRLKWRDNKDQCFLGFNRSLLYIEFSYLKIK